MISSLPSAFSVILGFPSGLTSRCSTGIVRAEQLEGYRLIATLQIGHVIFLPVSTVMINEDVLSALDPVVLSAYIIR
jgi:hypothetical protein